MKNLSLEFENCKKQFYNKNKFNLVMTLILQVIVAIINISLAYFVMTLIDAMETRNMTTFITSMKLMVVILTSFLISSFLMKFFKNIYIRKALSQFKNYVFERILDKSIGEFSSGSSGKFISAFSNDINQIENNYLNGNVMIFYYIVMLLITLMAMAWVNLTIMICVVIACSIPISISCIFGEKLVAKEKTTSDENASFVDQIKDLLNGFFVIKSFKAEKEVLTLFGSQNITLEETKRGRRDATDTMLIAGQASSFLVICVIFVLGIYFTFNGIMSIASVVACVQLSNYILDPIKQLVSLMSNRKASLSLIEKIGEAINIKEVPDERIRLDSIERNITLKDVCLEFDNGKVVLNNINISFEKGKKYAIVGQSGCGKSTLLRLLLGYFNNYEGKIYFDEKELDTINLDSLYDIVSVIQQNVFLFDRNIEDNITMFKKFEESKMERAINLAGLNNFIKEKGPNYRCGESGSNLSGGEKQRISIARCLIRETPVLLMDEATAALDNATAFQVENEILKLDTLTRIIVTHKLEQKLLERYDKIIVLKDGMVAEQGSFQQLMDKKKYFYSLYNVSS